MLIRAIRAENFMRFERLSIDGIPESGIVGIEGPNESGKSTLGELLVFAFFGQTRRAVESPTAGLIRWGADATQVSVEFRILPTEREAVSSPRGPEEGGQGGDGGDGGKRGGPRDYLIFRQIDRGGTNYVKVVELPSRSEVAAGNLQVAEFVTRHVRFDAAEFQQSFYHDQYEIRRVESEQVGFFDSATGVKQLLEAAALLRREIDPIEREFAFVEKEISRNAVAIEKHGRNAVKVPDLTLRVSQLDSTMQESSQRGTESKARLDGLRSFAGPLEERARKAEGLPAASIDEFLALAPRFVEEEEAAHRRRADGVGDESAVGASRAVSKSLEKLRAFAVDLKELHDRVRSEHALARRRLDDPELGPQAQLPGLAEGLRASRAAAHWGLARGAWNLCFGVALGIVSFFRIPAGIFSLDGFSGDGSTSWEYSCLLALRGLGALALFLAALDFWRSRKRSIARRTLEARIDVLETDAVRLRAELASLERILEAGSSDSPVRIVEAALAKGDGVLAALATHIASRHGELRSPEGLRAFALQLARELRELRGKLLAAAGRFEKQREEDDGARKRATAEREKVLNELRECQSQAAKKAVLEEKNKELGGEAARFRADIDRHHLAIAILDETVASVRNRLGPTLTRLMKGCLPRLTADRYRDLRVEPNLELRVFSCEKNDFLSVHELSGGTNEALTLALRLALSQALVSARSRQLQFVFLDEPFKMMDSRRIVDTLGVLRSLSPDLRQFFVIQPRFLDEERSHFDFVIRTSRESTSLSVSADPSPERGCEP